MYFYLEKASLINGDLTVIFTTESQIPNYKEITNFGELIEYYGENIPNNWEFDGEHFYDVNDKPSPYHRLNKENKWEIFCKDGFKKHCNDLIDTYKAELLEYGFDYNGHRQRCRDKDITFMAITALIMFLVQTFLGKSITKKWYFEDNAYEEFDMTGLTKLMFTGSTFIQAIYDAENHYKTLEECELITKDKFINKVEELQTSAMGV